MQNLTVRHGLEDVVDYKEEYNDSPIKKLLIELNSRELLSLGTNLISVIFEGSESSSVSSSSTPACPLLSPFVCPVGFRSVMKKKNN